MQKQHFELIINIVRMAINITKAHQITSTCHDLEKLHAMVAGPTLNYALINIKFAGEMGVRK